MGNNVTESCSETQGRAVTAERGLCPTFWCFTCAKASTYISPNIRKGLKDNETATLDRTVSSEVLILRAEVYLLVRGGEKMVRETRSLDWPRGDRR